MEDPNQTYRTLHFIVRHGDRLALAVTIGTLLACVLLSVATGALWSLPLGIVAGAFMYLIMRSYVELVRVIVDMLLPK